MTPFFFMTNLFDGQSKMINLRLDYIKMLRKQSDRIKWFVKVKGVKKKEEKLFKVGEKYWRHHYLCIANGKPSC